MSLESKLQQIADCRNEVYSSSAYARLKNLFDEGSMVELDPLVVSENGPAEVVTAYGTIDGMQVYAFAQNEDIYSGAFSRGQSLKIKKVYDFAVKTGVPVVGVYSSSGARLRQQGEILAAYGDMLRWTNDLSGVVPQISVILGACIGTSALIASSADIIIVSENADFGIDTAGNNQNAYISAQLGNIHLVTETDDEAIAQARKIISLLPQNNLSAADSREYDEAENIGGTLTNCAGLIGTNSRVLSYIMSVVADNGSFIELSPTFGRSALVGLGTMSGETTGFVGTRSRYADGKIDSQGAAKIARFVRFCDAFSIPVVTFVDTMGFTTIRGAAMTANAYAEATTVKISVIVGAAYGPAFIAMAGRGANADMAIAWPTAVIAPLAPETVTTIMYNDVIAQSGNPIAERARLIEEYKDTLASPIKAAGEGFIEDVINPADTRKAILSALDMLSGKRVSGLPKKHSNIQF
ncbi:MAG: carboxyl transferase [Oscillospiraceae bacterium]|jgi:acetyl-CoA carboxylase carboxyltransferase component|nr:carboxyl transferase [Oscillospiraceae bacterium]